MKKRFLLVLATAGYAALSGCEGGGGAPIPPAPDTIALARQNPANWRELIAQTQATKSASPEAFSSSGGELRVITELGPAPSAVSGGVLIANLLPSGSLAPFATFRSERVLLDGIQVDTSFVDAPAGTSYLYIAEMRGLDAWSVTVSERVGSSAIH